jgi:hypothetical protein
MSGFPMSEALWAAWHRVELCVASLFVLPIETWKLQMLARSADPLPHLAIDGRTASSHELPEMTLWDIPVSEQDQCMDEWQ